MFSFLGKISHIFKALLWNDENNIFLCKVACPSVFAQRIFHKKCVYSNWTNINGVRAPMPPLLSEWSICASVCVSPHFFKFLLVSLWVSPHLLWDTCNLFGISPHFSVGFFFPLCVFLINSVDFDLSFFCSPHFPVCHLSPLCGLGSIDFLSSQCFALWSFWSTKNIQDYFGQGILL